MRIRFDTKSVHVPRNGKFLEYPAISLGLGIPGGSQIYREVLIDTGASHTTFPLNLAIQLGVELDSLPKIIFKSASGHQMTGYVTTLSLSIRCSENSRTGWDWTGDVIMADIRTSLFGVLGHETFLEHFKFFLDSEEESFYLEENSSFTGEVLSYS